MRMILILIISAAIVPALAGCGDEGEGERPVVGTSTGILADIASRITGEEIELVQVIPDGSSPHDFQPSADDRSRLAETELIVLNGGGLDAAVPVGSSASWVLTDHAGDLLPFEEQGVDPHVWMDPRRVARALPSLAEALGEVAPEHAAEYRRLARAYAGELDRLDRELEARLRTVPPRDRELVTSHDSLAYFANRYGLEVVATPFPVTGAESEPSAAAVAEVIAAVQETDTRALFAEESDDAEVLEAIGAEAGVDVVTGLLVESPGSAGSYEEMLRHDAELIAAALKD